MHVHFFYTDTHITGIDAHGSQIPQFLIGCGINREVLHKLIEDQQYFLEIPNTNLIPQFYYELHHFLKHWPPTKYYTKTSMGNLYSRIDTSLSNHVLRADNVYRYVETMAKSHVRHGKQLQKEEHLSAKASAQQHCSTGNAVCTSKSNNIGNDSNPHYYQTNVDRREKRKEEHIRTLRCTINEQKHEICKLSSDLEKRESMVSQLSKRLNEVTEELNTTRNNMHCVAEERKEAEKQLHKAQKEFENAKESCERILSDFTASENVLDSLSTENEEIKAEIASLQSELMSAELQTIAQSNIKEFSFETKKGRFYSPVIRKLYYSLLSNQVPANKITAIIESILLCFLPEIDVSTLQLPKRSCADYMRREELTTVAMAHKADTLCKKLAAGECFNLNSDGTTKNQIKLNAVALNGLVLSVNEVADGTSQSIIEDIDKELTKLREAANQLNLPNANSINWTLFTSSTADSAATQKRLNRLLQDRIRKDELKYGPTQSSGKELVENFCAMHLGVNLRVAFLKGMRMANDREGVDEDSRHDPVDTFVHEFSKLFGSHGVPEYGVGVVNFPDFIEIQAATSGDDAPYFQKCRKLHLERQVGSRYFVTASNAGKILALIPAAEQFLQYTGKHRSGNKLERDIYEKIHDTSLMAALKADALMFCHIYADLVTLAKSNDLDKSVYDMNKHYLEMKVFLDEVAKYPEIAKNVDHQVFASEHQLYKESKLNHRSHSSYQPVKDRIFQDDEWDMTLLFPLLKSGATCMKDKLCAYARNQLPDGKYWEPEDIKTKEVLTRLKPNNDLCESILGLNDYLVTALPNMKQVTRSNIVTVKKNKTIQWLNALEQEQQQNITEMAAKNRKRVHKNDQYEEKRISERRRELMLQAHEKRIQLENKAALEKERLSKIHIISSVDELDQVISNIDDMDESTQKKHHRKMKILKEQVKARKKLLDQKVCISFSHHGKQRPLSEILHEVREFIQTHMHVQYQGCAVVPGTDPLSLVGRHILHLFIDQDSGCEHWYEGYILSYSPQTNQHEVAYVEEENTCLFDLTADIQGGDIKFLNV